MFVDEVFAVDGEDGVRSAEVRVTERARIDKANVLLVKVGGVMRMPEQNAIGVFLLGGVKKQIVSMFDVVFVPVSQQKSHPFHLVHYRGSPVEVAVAVAQNRFHLVGKRVTIIFNVAVAVPQKIDVIEFVYPIEEKVDALFVSVAIRKNEYLFHTLNLKSDAFSEFFQGARAVADRVLLFRRRFAESHAEIVG